MTSAPGTIQATTPNRLSKMPSNHPLNVNDLLNFSLPPRQTRPLTSLPRRSRKTGTAQGVWNKERFVNAQYRFVMNPSGDYTVHFADPDIFFQWQDILQVIIPRSSALATAAATGELYAQDEGCTTCPICLSPPTAPRMTKCGHVFCYPCILHYLSTSTNKWARCPICFDSVNERQLKCVKWYDGPIPSEGARDGGDGEGPSTSSTLDNVFDTASPRAGSSLHMRLVQRPQITTLALPRSHTWPSDLLPPHQAPFHFVHDVFSFAKFMLATPAYLIANLTQDLDELAAERRTLTGMNDTLGVMFIEGADHKVREQIAKASALETPALKEQIEKARREQQEIDDRVAFHARRKKAEEDTYGSPALPDAPHEFLASRSGGFHTPTSSVQPARESNSRPPSQSRNQPRQRRNLNPPPPSTSTYYYYQAASGLPLFLHPLDIRILLSHFNSYSSFPDTITVRVESVSEGTVNDDLRKRCKYLGHMPEGADVVFVEADLEGVVGAEGLKNFEGPLKMRTTRRKEKGRKEDRAKVRAEERERENLNTGVPSRPSAAEAILISDLPREDFSALGDVPVEAQSSSPPVQATPGAWGARSFASALHSSSPGRSAVSSQRSTTAQHAEDEWDIDVAWHELEQRNGGGGRRKRANKLVVLGSGGGGARRR
ncbi:hypothetical protein GALMADRAFT_234551 [Galerina marginata CBS 339.88]|uniref:RING-type domain-containing protein n=1 Tax=Galerina marginata (strain CBS 339.88) TaxID=685588 RepID=A0A067TZZ9_GALM3|nr:hypothetical protein GALMADRAFT_234551 [Galerina marginata CBS 339.88]